jgi:Fe(3+) dicitrate transport protein
MAVIGVGYAYNTVDVLLETVRTSEQFADDLNTIEPTPDGQRGLVPASTTWNAALNYTVAKSTLFVTVKNLFDELYIADRSRGILPGTPRLVQAGVRVRF